MPSTTQPKLRLAASDRVSRTMVAAINEIGHTMGIRTVAEFTDRQEVLQELRVIGVDYAQGYLIAKPIPLAQFHLANAQPRVAIS